MRDVLSYLLLPFSLTVFEESYIFADEEKLAIFAEDSAGGAFGITFRKLLAGKVCADYGRAVFIKTLVDKVAYGSGGELGRKFRAKVVNYEKITFSIFFQRCIGSGKGKMFALKLRNKLLSRGINNAERGFFVCNNSFCNRKGKVGLCKAGSSHHNDARRIFGKLVCIVYAEIVIILHFSAGIGSVGSAVVGVIGKIKIFERARRGTGTSVKFVKSFAAAKFLIA